MHLKIAVSHSMGSPSHSIDEKTEARAGKADWRKEEWPLNQPSLCFQSRLCPWLAV